MGDLRMLVRTSISYFLATITLRFTTLKSSGTCYLTSAILCTERPSMGSLLACGSVPTAAWCQQQRTGLEAVLTHQSLYAVDSAGDVMYRGQGLHGTATGP